MLSHPSLKKDFEDIDVDEILTKVEQLKLTTWRYKAEPEQPRHVGPMSTAFHEAFGLGANKNVIGVIDAFGIALAGVQALARRVRELEEKWEVKP